MYICYLPTCHPGRRLHLGEFGSILSKSMSTDFSKYTREDAALLCYLCRRYTRREDAPNPECRNHYHMALWSLRKALNSTSQLFVETVVAIAEWRTHEATTLIFSTFLYLLPTIYFPFHQFAYAARFLSPNSGSRHSFHTLILSISRFIIYNLGVSFHLPDCLREKSRRPPQWPPCSSPSPLSSC